MKRLKIAMMSMTHGHTRKYYDVLKNNPKLEWIAVSTANEEVKEIFLNSVQGIPCYDSDEAMLDAHPEIEAVVLASENSEHLRQVRLCAERKINILSMKIPTFDMDEYAEMERLVKESGITFQIELELHYNPVVLRMKDLIKNKAMGEMDAFNATNITLSPVWAFPWQGVPENKTVVLFSSCSLISLKQPFKSLWTYFDLLSLSKSDVFVTPICLTDKSSENAAP